MLYRQIILEWGQDTESGVWGLGYSPDNGKTFYVLNTTHGRKYRAEDGNRLYPYISDQIQDKIDTVVAPAKSAADSAQSAANVAVKNSQVNSQAIDDINSAVSDAVSDAAVARSDGLRAWNAAQSNVNLIDLNYASASASISSARTEAIAAADEAKASASAAQADIVTVKSSVATVQADVAATRSDVAVAKSDIADTKANLSSQATSLSSYAAQASAAGNDITTLKSQAGQLEQDIADTKGDVSQLKVSASAASVALSDAAGNISDLQATAKSFSAALSDTNSNVASVTATASELETKYADAAGDISTLQANAQGMTQTISTAQGDIANLKTRADGFDAEFATANGNISKLQTDATGTTQTLANTKSDVAVLQSRADGFDAKYANAAGDINTLKTNASGFSQTLTNAQGDISTLKSTVSGVQTTLTDAQGNISTLQSDVSGLKKTTSDDFNNLSQAVNLQTLDSADINNMKTNGHYFVHNLANTPISGWVYVDVVGNGTDRIRQDVYQDTNNQHCYRRLNGGSWTAWSQGATESEIVQLSDDINLRVKSADLISQINLQAGATLIQSNKLVLDAKTTVFTGDPFIPDAYISTINADKLMFYGSDGTSATMGASVAQYDDDKTKSTINLQYSGGIEIHSSDQQGSILTMHDNTIRLASKSWGDNPNAYQYSGFYAAPNYSLMNTYHKDGTTSGVAIDDNQIHIYGSSKDQQLGALQADVGWYSINGKTGLLTGDQITLKSASTQATLTDRNINIANTIDTNDKNYDVAIHIKGWAEMTGWFTCMGITQTSLLSTKTRIEPLDTKVALDKIVSANVNTYQFKTDVAKGKTKRHASVIIDDVHDVAEYYTPEEFISENRMGRDDGDIIGYLMGAVQELKKQLDELKEKI